MADKEDRPGGVLEISPAVARDMEKAKAGKIPAPPIEAFMNDKMVSEIEAATKVSDAPVHAESLIPITRAEAAKRTTFNGASLPSMPAPRRVIPPPFQRPSINGGKHGKTWQNVRADQVEKGDIIPGVGLVASARSVPVYETVAGVEGVPVRFEVEISGVGGVIENYRPYTSLRVFRKDVPPA